VPLIGVSARIITRQDMEHKSGKTETNTLGSGCRVSNTAMEYSDGQMEVNFKDNSIKI
jgi:hypothetical protein